MIDSKEMLLARKYIDRISVDAGSVYNLDAIGAALQVNMQELLTEVIDHTGVPGVVAGEFPGLDPHMVEENPNLKALLASEQMIGYLRGIVAARLEDQ